MIRRLRRLHHVVRTRVRRAFFSQPPHLMMAAFAGYQVFFWFDQLSSCIFNKGSLRDWAFHAAFAFPPIWFLRHFWRNARKFDAMFLGVAFAAGREHERGQAGEEWKR